MDPAVRSRWAAVGFVGFSALLAASATIATRAIGDDGDDGPRDANPGLARIAPTEPSIVGGVELTQGLEPDRVALTVSATAAPLPDSSAVFEIHVRVANTGLPTATVAAEQFRLLTPSGDELEPVVPTSGSPLGRLDLASTTAVDGWLAFEVPAGLSRVLLEFDHPEREPMVLLL